MRNLLLSSLALALSACGYDNVGACEDWVAASSCGETDMSQYVDCSVYENYNCDVADYFDCLTDNTTCDEATGVADMSGWTECTSLAACE